MGWGLAGITFGPIFESFPKSADKSLFGRIISFSAAEYRMALEPLVANHPLSQGTALQNFVLCLVKFVVVVVIIGRVRPRVL